MLNQVVWPLYGPLFKYEYSKEDIALLGKIINLVFPNTQIREETQQDKLFLEAGILTLTDGVEVELHPIIELVFNKLPYLVFSNNHHFVRMSRGGCIQSKNPIYTFSLYVNRYYQTTKKQKNFHL